MIAWMVSAFSCICLEVVSKHSIGFKSFRPRSAGQERGAENVFTDQADLLTYSYHAAVLEAIVPALALRPVDSESLGRVVRLCNENKLPLTVCGPGTNLSGGTIPMGGEVVALTNALNKILEINSEDMYAIVQPGAVTAKLAADEYNNFSIHHQWRCSMTKD